MNIQGLVGALNWLHGAFGVGGVTLGIAIANYQKIMAWLGSNQGKAVTADGIVILQKAMDILDQTGHRMSPGVTKDINAIIEDIQPSGSAPSSDAGSASKAAAILLALMLGASIGHCEVAISDSGTFGSAVYSIGEGGAIIPSGGTLVGDEINFGYGQMVNGSFVDYLFLSVGGALESRNGEQFGDLLVGVGTLIPSTGSYVVVGPAWRLFTGAPYPGITAGVNFQFGQPFWTSK